MDLKWCTKLDVVQKKCPIVFRGHPSNFTVTRAEKLTIWIKFEITRLVAAIKSLRFALLHVGWLLSIRKGVLVSKGCFQIKKYNGCITISYRHHVIYKMHHDMCRMISIHPIRNRDLSCVYHRSMLLVDRVIKTEILKQIASVLTLQYFIQGCCYTICCIRD